jgi:hypothetical protein
MSAKAARSGAEQILWLRERADLHYDHVQLPPNFGGVIGFIALLAYPTLDKIKDRDMFSRALAVHVGLGSGLKNHTEFKALRKHLKELGAEGGQNAVDLSPRRCAKLVAKGWERFIKSIRQAVGHTSHVVDSRHGASKLNLAVIDANHGQRNVDNVKNRYIAPYRPVQHLASVFFMGYSKMVGKPLTLQSTVVFLLVKMPMLIVGANELLYFEHLASSAGHQDGKLYADPSKLIFVDIGF